MPKATPAPRNSSLPKITVLSIGRSSVEFRRRNRILLDAGFHVVKSVTAEDAVRRALAINPAAVVIGHRVPTLERMEIVHAIRRRNESIPVILMYDGNIDSAEMADAILNVKGDPRDLIQTIQYLFSKPNGKG